MSHFASPHQCERAVKQARDQTSFINRLFIETLQWPIEQRVESIEDLSFGWSHDELRATDLDKDIIDGRVWQIQPLVTNQPWGIFLLEFKRPDAFITGRGMTGPLRKVLRGLVPSRRKMPHAQSWNREHLLFFCTHNYEHFRVAYFNAPPQKTAAAPLAAFGWGPDIPSRTACEFNLPALIWPETPSNADAWVSQWAAAFDVEKVTSKFYQDYASAFADVEGLIGDACRFDSDEDLRMFTQTLFNRLMFLRFIERKGWLDFHGRPDYLRALFDAGGLSGGSLYQSRLRPLFFEALAVDGKQESDAVGRVPFLNGGLFEQNDLDRRAKDVPDNALAPMIGPAGLFYRYNFTIEESTPLDIEVAVDPEMLGKVFEELVTGRHESGSYYTPRPIVSFMCRQALKGYLGNKTGASAAAVARLVDDHAVEALRESDAREILTALDDLKAVDPACGSGAYLLGLLYEMVAIYRSLYSERLVRDSRSLYDLKLRIISQNIYGVDIDLFATNIAMLRLWLSLAVEADTPIPLPNLDFKIETGDSLLGPCNRPIDKGNDSQATFDLEGLRARADALVELKKSFFDAHGDDKSECRRAIAEEEATIARELRAGSTRGVIDWRIQFAEAFVPGGGFDIVVANPPYVDSERMANTMPDYRRALARTFTSAKGNWDLYIPFFERGFRLMNATGATAFITPDKWASKPFGKTLRSLLFPYFRAIVRAGREVFQSSKVDALVCILSGNEADTVDVFDILDGAIVHKRTVKKDSITRPFAFDALFSDSFGFLQRIESEHTCLSSYGRCENACATSDAYKLKEIIRESDIPNPPDTELKVINTGTVGAYRSRWGQKRMTYLGMKLLRPVVSTRDWDREFRSTYGKRAYRKKIVIKGLTLLDACIDDVGSVIPGKSTLVVTCDDNDNLLALLGIINSPIAIYYLRERYPGSSYNQGTTFTKDMLNNLPVPEWTHQQRSKLVALVQARLSITDDDSAKATAIEHQINQVVYELYKLSQDEVDIVEA